MSARSELGEITSSFRQYVDRRVQQLTALDTFFKESLPVVADMERTNKLLIAAGRPDLAMTERAEMMSLEKPEDIRSRCNNFTPNFPFITANILIKKNDRHPVFNEYKTIPVTRDQMMQLRSGEVTPEDLEDESIKNSSAGISMSHATKPGFQRMLVLFPEFTIDLVLAMSEPTIRNKIDAWFQPELFVAYQLMSRLVDVNDHAVVEKGKVNDWYLCG